MGCDYFTDGKSDVFVIEARVRDTDTGEVKEEKMEVEVPENAKIYLDRYGKNGDVWPR